MIAGEFAQSHGAAGVELVGGDADFCAETELATIGETGGGVVHDAGGIDGAQKLLSFRLVGSDDAVGVVRAVGVDVLDRGIDVIDDFDREDFFQILGRPIFLGGGDEVGQDGEAVFAASELNPFFTEDGGDFGEKLVGDRFLDQQGFERVADTGFLDLGIQGQGDRHVLIGFIGNVDVANAIVVLDDRHPRERNNRFNEALATAGND